MITTLKDYKIFEKKQKNAGTDIIVVDVQDSFKQFFGDEYLEKVKEYCQDYKRVFQIWDSTKASKSDYLFPNQVAEYKKKYGGSLTPDMVEGMFTEPMWDVVKKKLEDIPTKNDLFETRYGDAWIYVGTKTDNLESKVGHDWFLCPKELMSLFKSFKELERKIILIGGAGASDGKHMEDGECLTDIAAVLSTLSVSFEINSELVYSNKGSQFQKSPR